MKLKLSALAEGYLATLRKYLEHGPQANLEPARALGRRAVGLGLETLDLARMHEEALATLGTSADNQEMIARARTFFAEAISPIERTHKAALQAGAHLDQIHKALNRRSLDLAASKRSLKESVVRRKTVEKALQNSGGHSRKLLAESRRLQNHLRRLAHQVLKAQENKRHQISHNLQDEIAQTLLGINVRLLTLKREAGLNAQGFKKELATTQRLVDKSINSIKRFAREFGKHQAT